MQNLKKVTMLYEDGQLNLQFVRKRNTLDKHDKKFSPKDCYHFIFWTRGGTYNDTTKSWYLDEYEKVFSKERICIHSCLGGKYMILLF